MNRCAGQSTTEFMLMVVLVTLMAVVCRQALWPAIPHMTDRVIGRVASDGRIPNHVSP